MLPCRGGVMSRCYNGTGSACSACRSLFLSLSGSLSPNQGGGGVVRGERWEAAGSASGTREENRKAWRARRGAKAAARWDRLMQGLSPDRHYQHEQA
jgi:hypothetical protein